MASAASVLQESQSYVLVFLRSGAAPLSRNRWLPSPLLLRLGSITTAAYPVSHLEKTGSSAEPRGTPAPGSNPAPPTPLVFAATSLQTQQKADVAVQRLQCGRFLQRLILVRYSDCDVVAAGLVNDEARSSSNRRAKPLIHHLCLCDAAKSASF